MEKKRKATTIRLSGEDMKAILTICMQYGLASDNPGDYLRYPFYVLRAYIPIIT